ncbi:MAG: peptidoglycan-binding domain-containing protein [Candidatus Acidiferrales bacterium]
MKKQMQIWRKLASRSALGVLVGAVALCFGPSGARAASGQHAHAKSHKAQKSKAAAESHKARLRNAAYKTPTHKRHRRRIRHHVILPKAPSAQRTEEIQAALQRGGYYAGNPTGKWDSSTQASLRRFQEANSLPPTGKLDALSLQKMGLGSDVAGVSAPRPVTPSSPPTSTPSTTPKTPGR